ncbi:hypothetical protein ACIBQ2_10565 [Micromonospora sediminimaris]|uniref:hypothetical protein n=1 Tax=Micromonospora sediminimaris TaxID=547162 RepID=UPI0037873605
MALADALTKAPTDVPELAVAEPPAPSDLLQAVVDAVFGPGSVIAWFVGLLILVGLWLRFGLDIYRGARQAGETIRAAVRISLQHLSRHPRHRIVAAFATTLFGLAVQAVWVFATFAFVCAVSAAVGAADPADPLRWDRFTGSYTMTCVLLLVAAYVLAVARQDHHLSWLAVPPAALPIATGAVVALIALVVTVAYLLSWLFVLVATLFTDRAEGPDFLDDMVGMWAVVVVLVLLALGGFLAMWLSAVTVSAWRGPAQEPTGDPE